MFHVFLPVFTLLSVCELFFFIVVELFFFVFLLTAPPAAVLPSSCFLVPLSQLSPSVGVPSLGRAPCARLAALWPCMSGSWGTRRALSCTGVGGKEDRNAF